jgi:hypothetical protein
VSSNKNLLEVADRIINENPEVFEALLEFERTGRLPKLEYKERVNFTIDAELMKKFRIYCKKKGYKMSSVIEKLIIESVRE